MKKVLKKVWDFLCEETTSSIQVTGYNGVKIATVILIICLVARRTV